MDRKEQLSPSARVAGWGVDAAPESRPGVPREERPEKRPGAHWAEPPKQHSKVEVLKNPSPEKPELTPVFGTAAPPRMLSGMIRRLAYHYPDHLNRKWMLLIVADRVDSLEMHVERLVMPAIGLTVGTGAVLLFRRLNAS